jgi:hypothetical protein
LRVPVRVAITPTSTNSSAEYDKAQSADGRVGDERLQVGLEEGYERAVDDVDNPEGRQVRQERLDARRQ